MKTLILLFSLFVSATSLAAPSSSYICTEDPRDGSSEIQLNFEGKELQFTTIKHLRLIGVPAVINISRNQFKSISVNKNSADTYRTYTYDLQEIVNSKQAWRYEGLELSLQYKIKSLSKYLSLDESLVGQNNEAYGKLRLSLETVNENGFTLLYSCKLVNN